MRRTFSVVVVAASAFTVSGCPTPSAQSTEHFVLATIDGPNANVPVGSPIKIRRSADGHTWTDVALPPGDAGIMATRGVAIGEDETETNRLLVWGVSPRKVAFRYALRDLWENGSGIDDFTPPGVDPTLDNVPSAPAVTARTGGAHWLIAQIDSRGNHRILDYRPDGQVVTVLPRSVGVVGTFPATGRPAIVRGTSKTMLAWRWQDQQRTHVAFTRADDAGSADMFWDNVKSLHESLTPAAPPIDVLENAHDICLTYDRAGGFFVLGVLSIMPGNAPGGTSPQPNTLTIRLYKIKDADAKWDAYGAPVPNIGLGSGSFLQCAAGQAETNVRGVLTVTAGLNGRTAWMVDNGIPGTGGRPPRTTDRGAEVPSDTRAPFALISVGRP